MPVRSSDRRRQGGGGPTDGQATATALAAAARRAGQPGLRPPHRGRHLRLAALLLLGTLFAAGAVWSVGLIRFARVIPDDVVDDTTAADAIVVLTGGSERLATGLRLLAERKGERVFISGVHPGVPVADLLRVAGIPSSAADSRVETGYGARDTAGNAEETAKWMRGRGYRSLRLVTGNYHMPRSLLEFEHALPDARLIPNPVFPHRVHQDAWWRNPGTAVLIVTEYTKYLLAKARHRLGLPTPAALRSALLSAGTVRCTDPPHVADHPMTADVAAGSARPDTVVSSAPHPANAGDPGQSISDAAQPAPIGPWLRDVRLRDVWLQALRAGAHWLGRC